MILFIAVYLQVVTMGLLMVAAFQDKNQALNTAHHILSSETCGLRYVELYLHIYVALNLTHWEPKIIWVFAPIVLLPLGVSHPGLASPEQSAFIPLLLYHSSSKRLSLAG